MVKPPGTVKRPKGKSIIRKHAGCSLFLPRMLVQGVAAGGAKRETSGHCICHTRRRQGRLHWDLAGHDVYRGPVVRN